MVKVPKGYRSRDVEDRRGSGGSGGSGGGFGFPSRSGGGSLGGSMGAGMPRSSRRGCGGGMGIALLIVFGLLFFMCSGGGDGGLMGDLATGPAPQAQPVDSPVLNDTEDLVNFVLDDVQDFWAAEYERAGQTYPRAKLVLFNQNVSTGGCGSATSQVGPFYCPADSKAYIDLQFMLLLQERLGAEGDFSQAYILAHEIGHHVQNVEGTNDAVRERQSQARSSAERNEWAVRMELQADCLAGMWARHANQKGLLDAGDLNEGVRAAEAVGDDAITGSSNQENFTHGSSAQRVRWFSEGFESGEYSSCDTFSMAYGNL